MTSSVECLLSDFYGAYNIYEGVKQRCWVHLLRDLKKLVEKHPDTQVRWVLGGKRLQRHTSRPKAWRMAISARCSAFVQGKYSSRDSWYWRHPIWVSKTRRRGCWQRGLTGFLESCLPLSTRHGVPSENNAAERAVRPAVIARKVSGGSRSAKGSKTRMTLMSLFGTWNLKGTNPIDACAAMLGVQD